MRCLRRSTPANAYFPPHSLDAFHSPLRAFIRVFGLNQSIKKAAPSEQLQVSFIQLKVN
jgi:hypothetical protein